LEVNFILELNNLSTSIKKISFHNSDYDRKLNNLPSSIEYIELSFNYQYQIKNIPKKLKQIKCFKNYKYINDFGNYQVIYI